MHELDELEELRAGAHHGVIVFALVQILKNLPDLFEGLEYGDRGEEQAAG